MKDGMNPTAVRRAPEPEEFTSRKLIRPQLSRPEGRNDQGFRERGERTVVAAAPRKNAPPEQTHAENFYYQKQMQARTTMVLVLKDGEEVEGVIEWYDRDCLKLNRSGEPNLLIYKPSIKYMFKAGENGRR